MPEETRLRRGLSGARATGFRGAYAAAFRAFLEGEDEGALRAAYEIGREAVSSQIGLLELAQMHHDVLAAELARSTAGVEPQHIARAAADVLLEALSAYEVVRRGFAEARELVAVERRQATMLRQLSTLLADASLAMHARSSVEEVLQLVAEQSRELTGAAWCVTHAEALGRETTAVVGADYARDEPAEVIRDADAAFQGRAPTTPMRVARSSAGGEIVASALAALDGRPVGFLAIAAKADSRFGELDQAILTHIAQMTGAALERAEQYRPLRSVT